MSSKQLSTTAYLAPLISFIALVVVSTSLDSKKSVTMFSCEDNITFLNLYKPHYRIFESSVLVKLSFFIQVE